MSLAPSAPAQNLEPIEVKTSLSDAGTTWGKKLQITVPAKEVGKTFGMISSELMNKVAIPGFRPGKVPRAVVEKRFAKDILEQAKGDLLQRAVSSAIQSEKLEVVGQPALEAEKVEIANNKDFSFEVEIEVKPSFTLGQYKGLPVEREEVEIFPEDVDEVLTRMAERFGEYKEVADGEGVKEKDHANGVAIYTVDGAEVHKDENAGLAVVDKKTVGVWGWPEDKFLLGMKKGETRESDVELPEHFPVEAQRGKKGKVSFNCTKITRPEPHPLNEEFAKKVRAENLDDLKSKITEDLREQLAEANKTKARRELVEKIASTTPFDVPPRLKDTFSRRLLMGQAQQMMQMGLDPEAVANSFANKKDDLEKAAGTDAEKEIREFFILDAICGKENITVADDEVDEEIVTIARSQNKRANELFMELEQNGGLAELKVELKLRKAYDFLEENAEVKVVPRKKKEKEAAK